MINKFVKGDLLLVGYGSIGRRHSRNLKKLGITPYILTRHPDNLQAKFLKTIKDIDGPVKKNIKYCIISSPAARHLIDLKRCITDLKGIKDILIEKPLECSSLSGKKIINIVQRKKINLYVGYNLRFINAFTQIKQFVQLRRDKIKIVEAVAGQDLKEWRASKDTKRYYSAYREEGGGVDFDLSHEIDYILWLFGNKFKNKIIYRAKISNVTVNSPDIFKLLLDYGKFVVDITLDYIRKPKERYLKIICDDGEILYHNFITDDIDGTYKKILKTFLGIDKKNKYKLCSPGQALKVLQVLEV